MRAMRWTILLLTAALLTVPLAMAEQGGRFERNDPGVAKAKDQGDADRDDAKEKAEVKDHHGHFDRYNDKWVLRNDQITIWMHLGDRSKPALAVFQTGEDGNRSGFGLMLEGLCEVGPQDAAAAAGDDGEIEDVHDQVPFHRVAGHCVNLHPAREWWTHVDNGSSEVTITMSHLFNQGNVTLVFHVPTDGGQVKFDVRVNGWAWADPADKLVLGMRVVGRGAEHKGAEAVFDGGYVHWATEAKVKDADGTVRTIPVEGSVKNKDHGARILLLFNGTGGYRDLDYDPTIGVQSAGIATVPGMGMVAAIAIVGVAAIAARSRRLR